MDLPNSLANRDAYRRSLQNSLHDVLGDVGIDAGQMGPAAFQQQPFANLYPTPPPQLQQPSTLNQLASLGLNFGDLLRAHQEQEQVKAAYLQSLAAQQNTKAIQDAYLALLRSNVTPVVPSMVPKPMQPAENKKKIAETLQALGTNLRSRYDPFIDCLHLEDPEAEAVERSRGGVSEHFPRRLHRMLADVEKEGKTEVVSFYSHGRAFAVHDMERFTSEIMPKYFKQSKWNSFSRQLNLYGFLRLATGPDAGAYYHELFLKSRPSLCRYMRRVGVPQGQQDRRKCRPKNVVDIKEPDFYSMEPAV